MIVPDYWAEAKIQNKVDGRSVTIKRFGWSNSSPEEAQDMAQRRAREAMSARIAGEDVRRIDHKVAYNGAEGLPIREEVISRIGDQVITRNSYGALCLNSPNVLFVDMDFKNFETQASAKVAIIIAIVFSLIAGILSQELVVAGLVFIACFFIVYSIALYIKNRRVKKEGGIEQIALNCIDSFSANNKSHLMRIYRTPFGLRALFMEKTFAPQCEEVSQIFDELNADPIYASMCSRQNCFRARISPKPWRMNMERLNKTGVWPISKERQKERQKWVERYEKKSTDFASCRFLKEIGSGLINSGCDEVRKIHDEYCQAETNKVLA